MAKEIAEQMVHIQETIRGLNIQQSNDNPEVSKQFGYLKFDEDELDSTTHLSQYIRLALRTDATAVVKFMQNGWLLPAPDLIISVTGGGKQCKMSTHLRKTFQRGLVVAAATTNAWLTTAGTNVGVVKEVGAALNNYRYKNRKHGLDVPCIGICSWQYTAGTEQLNSSTMESRMTTDDEVKITVKSSKFRRYSRTKVQLDMGEENYIRSYVVKQPEAKRCDLEPNHTHFLLFDGKSSKNDDILSQRAKIEKYSRRIHVETSAVKALIPIVMILVEGGPFSVRTVCQALQSNTPLVVVKGSGRASDLVADLHILFSQVETEECGNEQRVGRQLPEIKNTYPLDQQSQNELNSIFEKYRANNSNVWIDNERHDLCRVLYYRKQIIVVFEFDSPRHHGNLEDAILEALFNAAKFSKGKPNEQKCQVSELKLAMAWQKLSYAKKHILTDTTISEWDEADLCQALVDALRRGYVDFVELLIDYGTSLKNLTVYNLEQLYASSDGNPGLPVEDKSSDDLPTRDDYYKCYFPDQSDFHRVPLDKNSPLGQNATREFFLWAIFLDRFELATYLCSKTWNQFVAPLIAARIYQQAITLALHSETQQRYEDNASQFDIYAKSIIDRCFECDEHFAVDLLKQPAVAFDNIEPLIFAEQVQCRSFLASECVQRYLDEKWFGHINYKRQLIQFRIFLCSLFLPLLPFFSVFLPYVQEEKQIIRSDKNYSKNKSSVTIRTVLRSDRDITDNPIRWSEKVIYFYQAPIVRFYYNVIFHVLFLGLFSFVVLIDFLPFNVQYEKHSGIKNLPLPISEIVLHIFTWSLIVEEIRQFRLTKSREYFFDIWNLIDFSAILLYLIAFITRFIVLETFFIISKISLCLDLIVWFVGTLHMFAAFERLGPKLVMIFNTMRDLSFFVCFIIIFLCGFSITSWSLLTSASQVKWIYDDDGQLLNVTVSVVGNNSWTWQSLRDITQYGVWKVFGQIDPIVGTDSYSNIAFILAIIFVAVANILLLNVLIALFNVTIQNVQAQSHDLWRYQRFLIVNEFSKKTPLPPPFNIIYYLFHTVRLLIARLRLLGNQHRFIIGKALLHDVRNQQQFKISDAMRRESAITADYWGSIFKHNKKDRLEVALQNLEQKIDHFIPRIHEHKKHTLVNQQSYQPIYIGSDV